MRGPRSRGHLKIPEYPYRVSCDAICVATLSFYVIIYVVLNISDVFLVRSALTHRSRASPVSASIASRALV